MDILSKGDEPAVEGWVVTVGVLGGGYLNRGDAGLNLYLFAYMGL
jgi:hypothetical protein